MDAYGDHVERKRARETGSEAAAAVGEKGGRSLLVRWRWALAPLIFFGGNLVGWALDPGGLVLALPCMLVLWWAVPLWLGRGLRGPRMGKVRADVRDTDGRWWVRQGGHWWGHVEETGTWERGARYDLPAGYGRQEALVWNVQASDANGVLDWIGGDGAYRVVSADRHTVGDPIWACNNRVSLHLRRR